MGQWAKAPPLFFKGPTIYIKKACGHIKRGMSVVFRLGFYSSALIKWVGKGCGLGCAWHMVNAVKNPRFAPSLQWKVNGVVLGQTYFSAVS